jgi:hypothetical protein
MRTSVRLRATAACISMLVAWVGPTIAQQSAIQHYYESMKDICRTGVLPEMTALWLKARQEMEATRERNNFAGLKSPTDTWLDCFQSPGDGKE